MKKIIAIASHKGGVGKTTTVLNLGFSLNQLGQKVMLIDGDPQGGIAIASNLKKRTTLGIINLLKNDASPKDVIIPTRDKTMSVVGIGAIEPEDVLFMEKEALRGNLGRIIQSISDGFDYVLLDSPAGLGGVVTALLTVSDGVIIPINCHSLVVKTIPSFLKLINRVRDKLNPSLRIEGMLINMFNEKKTAETEVYNEMMKQFPPTVFFNTLIPFDENVEGASIKAIPVGMLPEAQNIARAYIDLATELRIREIQVNMGGVADEYAEGLF